MIKLEHVTKRYGRLEAVSDLCFSAEAGGIIGLLGQNGAGKTTTLNMLTGYFPPDEGRCLVNGLDMLTESRSCKRLIGYLPEKPPLYDEMTVAEYLTFVCRLREVTRKAIPEHLDRILQLCGLTEVRNRRLGGLSKGYRQRAGFAQALCGDPPVLVLDEPTVGLDPRQVVEIRELMRLIGQDHTVVFSSHILSEVQQLCSRALILHKGKKVFDAPLNSLAEVEPSLTLRVSVYGEAKQLLPQVKTLPCVRQVRSLPAEAPGTCCFDMVCTAREKGPDSPQIQLFHLLSRLNAPILSLNRIGSSLEEVFLRVTAEGSVYPDH